ncbi:hypothetical protein ACFQO1_02775 [Jejudonia soesokkakensis]|uniref:Uncharacterized protein n=1 Tax=Jejudonia soesokkakensis TaxID=1323432 RepID=A0ABW2MPE9_9FLAO
MSQGFEENYAAVMVLFALVFFTGSLLLAPVMMRTKSTIQLKEIITPIIFMIGVIYIITSIFASVLEYIPDLVFYVLSILMFLLFVFMCFYIAFINKHPKNIYVFIVGIGYTLVCSGAVLYEMFYPSVILIGAVNLFEIIAQFYFVLYITHIAEIAKEKKWFI